MNLYTRRFTPKPLCWGLKATHYVYDAVLGRMISFKGRISAGGVPVSRKQRQERRMLELSAHCHLYHDLKKPVISDLEYEAMKARLRARWSDSEDGKWVIPDAKKTPEAMIIAKGLEAK